MLVALVTIGVLLILFGGLVLLKFPDRPGGEIEFHGVRIQATSAGLPLIVLGLAVVALVALQGISGPEPSGAPPATDVPVTGTPRPGTGVTSPGDPASWPVEETSCIDELLDEEPSVRDDFRTLLPVGQSAPVLTGIPVALLLVEDGETIGAVRFVYTVVPSPPVLTIHDVVDAACQAGTSQIREVSNGLVVELALPDRNYQLAITYESHPVRSQATLQRV